MDDDDIREAERLQIEHIRQLEYEELQVEEVDDYTSDSSEDLRDSTGVGSSGEFTFNTSLAPLHTYLGEVDDTHHRRTFLDGGSLLTLPLFYLQGVVLFREATLPLRVIQPNFISVIERALGQADAPYTIGVVHVHHEDNSRRYRLATIGTTAEIRQYRRLEDGSLNVVTRGQQRFHLKRRWIDAEGVPCGEVQIIQEDIPLRTPRDVFGKVAPLSNLHCCTVSQAWPSNASYGEVNDFESNSEESFEHELSPEEKRVHQSAIHSSYGYDMSDESTSSNDDERSAYKVELKNKRHYANNSGFLGSLCVEENVEVTSSEVQNSSSSRDLSLEGKEPKKHWKNTDLNQFRRVSRTFSPYWVYHLYDSYCLAKRAAEMWKQIIGAPSMDSFVRKPDLLSFHIASKIPVSEPTRQELLEIDGISFRLRREIELLQGFNLVRCKTCRAVIAKRSDMLVMSSEGPLGAYVNPHGFVHEVMTLLKANGLALIGRPATEYSWFPGYAWTIANCANCETQMGWLFTATKKKLKPPSFWGLRSCQVTDDKN